MPILKKVAKRDPSRTKFLVFGQDYWPWAAAIALELQRAGFDYAVAPEHGLPFGLDHVRDANEAVAQELPLWKIGDREKNTESFPLFENGPVVTFTPPKVIPGETQISFEGEHPSASPYMIAGWSPGSSGAPAWSPAKTAALYFVSDPSPRDVDVVCDVTPASLRGEI